MIDISKLTALDIGRAVVYKDHRGKREDGVISSWNASYIFVRYRGELGAKATSPGDLDWPGLEPPPEAFCVDEDGPEIVSEAHARHVPFQKWR